MVIYGYVCRWFSIYYFWESKFIGCSIIFLAIIAFMLERIKAGKKIGQRRIVEKLVMAVLVFILVVQVILYTTISNSDAYEVAKEFITNNQRVKEEVGSVIGFSIVPLGTITTSSRGEGNAKIYVIVKGDKKFLDMSVSLATKNGEDWQVSTDE